MRDSRSFGPPVDFNIPDADGRGYRVTALRAS